MKQFEDIKKQMPYAESEDYLEKLIASSTENAIARAKQPKAKVVSMRVIASIAASIAFLVTVGLLYMKVPERQIALVQQTEEQLIAADNGPIDDFLNTLSDDEAQLLAYYDIDEIPEY
jgi:hypothetical protein